MGERRLHRRFVISNSVIRGRIIPAVCLKFRNVSAGGIAFSAERRLNMGCEYRFRVEDRQGFIDLRGTVIWSALRGARHGGRGDTVPVYEAGLRFHELRNVGTSGIADFLRRCEEQEFLAASEPAGSGACAFKSKGVDEGIDTGGPARQEDVGLAGEVIARIDFFYRYRERLGLFKILDLDELATDSEIRNACRRKFREFYGYGQQGLPHDLKEKVNVILSCLQEARMVLLDPGKRKAYERGIRPKTVQPAR